MCCIIRLSSLSSFQSFWVNGLLWKSKKRTNTCRDTTVSILLGQWITLEVLLRASRLKILLCFNPSGSMDYFGRPNEMTVANKYGRVSILLGQWITLEDGLGCVFELLDGGFNPSGSMDYFGSLRCLVGRTIVSRFQSFWVNGLLWKAQWCSYQYQKNTVSILLGQWITLEAKYRKLLPGRSTVSILLGQWITLEV